jgi:hypothetical protein
MLSMPVHLLESQEKSRNLDRWAASKAERLAFESACRSTLTFSFQLKHRPESGKILHLDWRETILS